MMEKHACLILAHTNPNQLCTLLSLLDDERNDIYVHIDAKSPIRQEEIQVSCKRSKLTFVKREKLSWGGPSIVRAEMNLLKEATRTPHSYYHLLSGMDLPIKSNDFIFNFFNENAGKEFLNCWNVEEHTLRRVKYFTPFPESNRFFLTNMLNHAVKAILKFLGCEMNKGVQFRQGSQWFSITEPFAKFIVDNAEWVENTYRYTCVCDELVIPTLLEMSPFKDNLFVPQNTGSREISLGNMRLIDWSRGSSIRHPWTFTEADFDFLKHVPHLWARKFDEKVDSVIIEKISKFVKQ